MVIIGIEEAGLGNMQGSSRFAVTSVSEYRVTATWISATVSGSSRTREIIVLFSLATLCRVLLTPSSSFGDNTDAQKLVSVLLPGSGETVRLTEAVRARVILVIKSTHVTTSFAKRRTRCLFYRRSSVYHYPSLSFCPSSSEGVWSQQAKAWNG